MAYFRKRGKTWHFTASFGKDPHTGERVQIARGGFKDEKEARKAFDKLERDHEKGLKIDSVTVEEFITKFFQTIVINQVSESTYISQWVMVQKHIIPKLGHYKVDKVTVEIIDKLYNELLKDGMSRGYLSKGIAPILSKTFKQAMKWNYVVKNVVKEASAPSYKPKKVEMWSEEQLYSFLNATRQNPRHALYVLGGTSGMRIGEMLALHWSDIDTTRNVISITKSLKYTKSRGLHLKDTKTDNSERTITVPRSTIDALLAHKEKQLPDVPFLFDNFSEFVYPQTAWREFQNDCVTFNMPKMKIHGLRHTHATLLLSKGFNAKVVAERLGDTVETVMRTYAHVLPNMQKEVAASLDNLYKSVDNSDTVGSKVVKFIRQ